MKVLLVQDKNLISTAGILKNNYGAEVSMALTICQAEGFFKRNKYDLILVFEPQLIGLDDPEIQQLCQEFGGVRHYWYGGIAFIRRILKKRPDLAGKIIFVSHDMAFHDEKIWLQREMSLVKMFHSMEDYWGEIAKKLKE